MTPTEDVRRDRMAALVHKTHVGSIKRQLEEEAWQAEVEAKADAYEHRQSRQTALAIVAGIVGAAAIAISVGLLIVGFQAGVIL